VEWHRYRRALFRHCARVVGDTDAEEAVQEALLKAHRALAGGTPVHNLGPWLHAIAHNSALATLAARRAGAECRWETATSRSTPTPFIESASTRSWTRFCRCPTASAGRS
jgi:DNA-directed RNA polymerase specialized sigma24 family protein